VAPNKEWHRSYRMPTKATHEQHVAWRDAHAAACGCREVPLSIRANVLKSLKGRRKP
jgi:hypothetical protein